MKALISPVEPVQTGYRVAEIHPTGFEVAPPLFWIDCNDNIIAHKVWYDPVDQQMKAVPPPVYTSPEHVVSGAQSL